MSSQEKLTNRSSIMIPPRQTYSFPLLKTSNIILCLNELGLSVTEDELSNPEKYRDQIRRIYEHLTELCTGITREEMAQPAFAGLQRLTYPELHDESIQQINSFRACQKMLEVCGIYDFTIKDLMSPTSKRLKRQLSGIINFAKFREERYMLLTELSTHRDSILSNWNKSKAKNEELHNRLNTLREQTAEEASIIASIEGECKDIEGQINELNHLQAEIREEIADLKLENTKLKDTLASRNLEVEDALHTQRKLQGQIVSSPDRFRKQIVDVAQQLQQEQSTIRTSERKLKELLAWTGHLEEAQGSVLAAQDSLNETIVEFNKHKSLLVELDEKKLQHGGKRDVLKTLDQNVLQLNRQTTRAEEKLIHIRKQSGSRGHDSQISLQQLNQQLHEAQDTRKQIRSQAENLEAECNRAAREIEVEKQIQKQVFISKLTVYT
jgi:kinetochore protein Nuf2